MADGRVQLRSFSYDELRNGIDAVSKLFEDLAIRPSFSSFTSSRTMSVSSTYASGSNSHALKYSKRYRSVAS
jgi:hypothetical protein